MKIIIKRKTCCKKQKKKEKLGTVQHTGLEIVKAVWFQLVNVGLEKVF